METQFIIAGLIFFAICIGLAWHAVRTDAGEPDNINPRYKNLTEKQVTDYK